MENFFKYMAIAVLVAGFALVLKNDQLLKFPLVQ